jgi:hypothetical protein
LTSSRLSPFFLLGLTQDATHVISMLALLQEANAQDVIVWEHFVHFYILLLMLLSILKKSAQFYLASLEDASVFKGTPF